MAYFHNVQQTRNSGLDWGMRLAADPEFVSFVRSKRKLLALKNFTVKEQWSICSLFGRVYAISTCHSLGKIKTQKIQP